MIELIEATIIYRSANWQRPKSVKMIVGAECNRIAKFDSIFYYWDDWSDFERNDAIDFKVLTYAVIRELTDEDFV